MNHSDFQERYGKLTNRQKDVLKQMLSNAKEDKEIASSLAITEASIRKHIQRICEVFQIDNIPGQRSSKRLVLIDLFSKHKPELVSPQLSELQQYQTNVSGQIPLEFINLIKDKTDSFYGRQFVFEAIEKFIKNNPNGYFTVVGDAGMGKSAIAAKYVLDNPGTVCFLNVRSEGRNRPELFLKSVRQQLLNFYPLPGMEDADLVTLLTKVRENIPKDKPLVIVVDALDEVDQEGTGNLLYLPTILPEGVYFILTRRPYAQNEQRLNLSPSVPTKILDLRKKHEDSQQDVQEYINQLFSEGKYNRGLQKWVTKRKVSQEDFVSEIAVKSENNFMYLRCVLSAIAEGFYNDKSLDELPEGLQGYYYSHWQLMGMTSRPLPKHKIKIIYVMCALLSAASPEVIAKYSRQDLLDVQDVLAGWAQFLQKQNSFQSPRYRFYHESFRDFLHRRDIVKAAEISLPEINAEVARNMTEGLEL